MTHSDALKIVDGFEMIAECAGVETQEVIKRSMFFDEKVHAVVNEAIKLRNEFLGADMVQRGKFLGINITVTDRQAIELEG
jgi:hypothetical protein